MSDHGRLGVETARVCHGCSEEREKKGKPVRHLFRFMLDFCAGPMFLCAHCDGPEMKRVEGVRR